MCTVTYVPNKKGFVFTSNRDEQRSRKTIAPASYIEQGVSLFYPKDEVAGGTWIGVSEHKRLVCLLNGGFVYHDPTVKFPKSRGVVVKSILTSKNLLETLNTIDLNGVAPFTLIVVDWNNTSKIYELVWCRKEKKVTELSLEQPYIWSSSTLYTEEMKIQRKKWFDNSVVCQSGLIEQKVLAFHQNETLGSVEVAPKMKRNVVETISTTLVVCKNNKLSMEYYDYVNDKALKYKHLFTPIKA
ncbi:NRDE family protein [Wenyingzhuangia sp. IMCC45467]